MRTVGQVEARCKRCGWDLYRVGDDWRHVADVHAPRGPGPCTMPSPQERTVADSVGSLIGAVLGVLMFGGLILFFVLLVVGLVVGAINQ